MTGERPRVAIVWSSPTDEAVMGRAGAMLARFGLAYDEAVLSPYRSPRALADYAAGLEQSGVEVVIAGSAGSAALPGLLAGLTTLPVIGVPIRGGALDGVDALLTMTGMPAGIPVAVVGLDNATNAAVLAAQILSVADPQLRVQLATLRDDFEKAAADEVPSR